MSELVDRLMDGTATLIEAETLLEVVERKLSKEQRAWLGVKAFNRLDPNQCYTHDMDASNVDLTDAVRDLVPVLRHLAHIMHRSLNEADPDGTLDTDPVAFARKAAER